MLTAFVGARVFDGERFIDDAAVLVREGDVAGVVRQIDTPDGAARVELEGGVLAPGFVDVQVNGGGDVLFNDTPTPDAISAIVAAHARFGTTGMTPTLISDHDDVLRAGATSLNYQV